MTIEERLEALENLVQQAGIVDKDIRANRFVLEDKNGNRRAELSVDKGMVNLGLHEENRKLRLLLAVDKLGPCLCLYDEKEHCRAFLRVWRDGPSLELCNEKYKKLVGITATKEEGPLVLLCDEYGKPIWAAP